MDARLCAQCGNAWAIDRTNDWIVITQVTRLDNLTPRVDENNEPIQGELCSWPCAVLWTQARGEQVVDEPAAPQAMAVQ